jgi:hypothetical protein
MMVERSLLGNKLSIVVQGRLLHALSNMQMSCPKKIRAVYFLIISMITCVRVCGGYFSAGEACLE